MSFISYLLNSRWALKKEAAEKLASSTVKYLEKENGWFTARKPDGEINAVNNITLREDGIAVIHVDGVLSYRTTAETVYFGEDTYNSIEAAFDECLANSEVKGIVFDINSPGGACAGCADLANKIFEARGSKTYGIVARTGGEMASAAYWLGSSCEKVYASESALLGSIGTLAMFSKVNDDVVTVTVVKSDLSPNKAPSPDSKEGVDLIKAELNDLTSVFVSAVARNRGTTFENVIQNYGQGGMFVGAKAVEAGLADAVMSLDGVCEEMKKGHETFNGGAAMASSVKTNGNAGAGEGIDVEAIRAEAVAAYQKKVASVDALFDGLEVSAEEKTKFTTGSGTVEEATAFALEKAKSKISAMSEELKKACAERDEAVAKASANGEGSEKDRAVAALAASAAAQNEITAGSNDDKDDKAEFVASIAKAAELYYNNKGGR